VTDGHDFRARLSGVAAPVAAIVGRRARRRPTGGSLAGCTVAHLTTVDLSLEYLLLPQLRGARAAGADVVGISAPGPSVPRLAAVGVRHIPLPGSTRGMDLRADLHSARALWRILRAERPHVLHTHNPKPGVYGRIVGRLAGVPLVVNTVHGLYATPEDRWRKRLGVYAMEAVAARFSDVELVQNEEDLDLLGRWRLTPPRKLRFLGNGVDLDRFRPDAVPPDRRHALRAELGAPDDDTVVVGIVARLVHEKGYRELIAAAEQLGPDVVIVAVGGPEPDKADGLTADELARAERAGIRLLGHRDDVRDLYAAMDVVVLPSYREGVPRSLMEAAASARPLVATDVRGCRQVVVDGVNGRLIPARSATALADAIAGLAADPAARAAMGVASRALAEERWDEDDIIARVLRSYGMAADGAAHRAERPVVDLRPVGATGSDAPERPAAASTGEPATVSVGSSGVRPVGSADTGEKL
jgi:glycosyltransferase involved in cell wall biosynthesis